jgi:DNA adenine methylase
MQVEYRGLEPVKAGAKSPLRYPGGKSRAIKHILPLIPAVTRTLLSPFIGGGSVELAAAACGVTVRGYDIFAPLVNFWQTALTDPEALAALVEREHPLPRERFYELQRDLRQGCPPGSAAAALFFILNRASVSGSTLSGGTSEGDRFTPSAIRRLRDFACPNLTVGHARFEDSLAAHPDDCVYADPPYVIPSNLYGNRGDTHKGFDHAALAACLRERDSSWVLSYNDCPEVRALYRGHAMLTPAWTYGMGKSHLSSELLILSHDLAQRHQVVARPRRTADRAAPVACGYALAAA